MNDLKIVYLPIDQIRPYEKNARKHQEEDLATIRASIQAFGFRDPIGIWGKQNTIVEGHGRLMAAKELGMDKVPCIRLDDMTDEERRAYALAHNKTAEMSAWEPELLDAEILDIDGFDMSEFGFDVQDGPEEDEEQSGDDGYYGDERERNFNSTKFNEYDPTRTEGRYEIPVLKRCDHVPSHLIGFNYARTSNDYEAGVHFYIDDYQFERVWNDPYTYIPILSKFDCCMTPNFSIYRDMPEAIKIWNTYRARLLGQMFQDSGIKVIPIVYWSDERSWDYCFDGLPENSTLSVNNIRDDTEESKELWDAGMDEWN